jgi:hypothetical protein
MNTKAGGVTPPPSKRTQARRRNAAVRRERIIEEGGRRLEILIEADAAQALEHLEHATGDNATGVISKLLLRSAARRR